MLLETFSVNKDVRVRHLGNTSTVLNHSELLELLDGGGGSVLLSVVEWVVLLRDLESNGRIEDENTYRDDSAHKHDHSRPLLLEMHSTAWVR